MILFPLAPLKNAKELEVVETFWRSCLQVGQAQATSSFLASFLS